MRVQIYTVAIPLLTAVAFAQDTPPPKPQQPSEQSAPAVGDKTSKDTSQDKNKAKGAAAPSPSPFAGQGQAKPGYGAGKK